MTRRMFLGLYLTISFFIVFTFATNAGVISKGGRALVEKATFYFAKKETKTGVAEATRIAKARPEIVKALETAFQGKNPDEIARLARWLNDAKILRELPQQEVGYAVDFLGRNGREGALVLRRFGWQGSKDRSLTATGAEEVVKEAGRLIGPGLEGSWVRLREALRKANVTGRNRDFAEEIFLDRAIAGRIPGLQDAKIFPGQHNGVNGIDFIAIEKEQIRIIEFSTGKKTD